MSLRVAILADYAEEGWPSMDLVADALIAHLRSEHADHVSATLVRPAMPRRFSRRASGGEDVRTFALDRVTARQWHYPAVVRALPPFDVYHVVDHSYGHLAHAVPAGRAIVTCHDVDAFRSIAEPPRERRSLPFRWMSRRILDGLRRAACVPCDTEATREALIAFGGFDAGRLTVIPNGADTGAAVEVDRAADAEAARLLGPRGPSELLHVGSTIPRKRIDVLLEVFAAVRRVRPSARLIRVGGPFTAEQRVHARTLGVLDRIVVVPFVDRATLGAIYRRAGLALLPSEREGFGLPIVEALACGTPVVASDIPVLREVGGSVVAYCPVADVEAWSRTIAALLDERDSAPVAWQRRRDDGARRASDFSWSAFAAHRVDGYRQVAAQAPGSAAGSGA
jgi:glycosyltransferase involved in cell wall biosynthesis